MQLLQLSQDLHVAQMHRLTYLVAFAVVRLAVEPETIPTRERGPRVVELALEDVARPHP